MLKKASILNASLFITATTIGISYFTVPILTGIAGFLPGVIMTLVVWAFTLAVSLLFAEATLTQPEGANLISISRALLGKAGMWLVGIVYMTNLIAYLPDYVYYLQKSIVLFFDVHFHMALPSITVALITNLPIILLLMCGMHFTFRVNAFLTICLGISIFSFISLGNPEINTQQLLNDDWIYVFFSVPTLFSALAFSVIIPPICTYLKRDPKKITMSMFIGTLLTLLILLLWQWVMIGVIPTDSLWVVFEEKPEIPKVVQILSTFPKLFSSLIYILFFSMATSLIGYGLAAIEFFSDGLGIPQEKRVGWRRVLVCLFLFLFTTPLAQITGHPSSIVIQNFTAPIGVVLMNGIIPLWMAVQARYIKKLSAPRLLPGGKWSLFSVGLAIFILIYLEGIMFIRI